MLEIVSFSWAPPRFSDKLAALFIKKEKREPPLSSPSLGSAPSAPKIALNYLDQTESAEQQARLKALEDLAQSLHSDHGLSLLLLLLFSSLSAPRVSILFSLFTHLLDSLAFTSVFTDFFLLFRFSQPFVVLSRSLCGFTSSGGSVFPFATDQSFCYL